MLPWWDWTTARTIPRPFTERRRPDGRPNPLTGVTIRVDGEPEAPPTQTTRSPGTNPRVPPLPYGEYWNAAMQETTFEGFSDAITAPHDWVHVWTGGQMSDQNYAAYDPLFWSHHAMVDRAWALWQNSPNGADPAPELLDIKLQPTGRTVREMLSINQLGYDYAGTTAHVGGSI
jgi:tyrosinase